MPSGKWGESNEMPSLGSPPCLVAHRHALGTRCEIFFHSHSPENRHAAEVALDELTRIDGWLSRFDPASEVWRINHTPPLQPLLLDYELTALLRLCQTAWELTEGAFDIVAGSRDPAGTPLTWQDLDFNPQYRRLAKTKEGLQLDFGGIGKGYALDQAAHLLRKSGLTAALLNAGQSSQYALNESPTAPDWTITLPDGQTHFPLRSAGLSTSASTPRRTVEDTPANPTDILSPTTGTAVSEAWSVTATAPTATWAEVATTAWLASSTAQRESLWSRLASVGVIPVQILDLAKSSHG